MIENIAEIATALGVTPEQFKADYESADKKVIPLTDIEIVKKSDLETRIKNERVQAGKEFWDNRMKFIKEKHGIAVDDNSEDKIFDAYKAKVIADAKISPDKKVKELTEDLEAVKKNYEKLDGEYKGFKTERTNLDNRRKINDTIIAKIPDGTIIPKEKVLTIFHTEYESELTDTGIVYKKDGQVLKNKTTLSPLSIDEIMVEFITPYAKPATGGSGGKDDPGTDKPGSIEEFTKQQEAKGNKPGTEAFNRALQEHLKKK